MAIKQFFKRKKTEFLQKRAADVAIKKKALAAGLREREKQSIKVAEEREKIRAKQKIKSFSAPSGGGGAFSAITSGAFTNALIGGSSPTPQRAAPVRRRTTTRRKTTKRTPQRRKTTRRKTNLSPVERERRALIAGDRENNKKRVKDFRDIDLKIF